MLLVGVFTWAVGVVDPFGEHILLSLVLLVLGGVVVATTGMLLLASRPSGRLEHRRDEAALACGSFGIGLASLGFAISPQTRWTVPAAVFAIGGIALMAWAPHALGRGETWRG